MEGIPRDWYRKEHLDVQRPTFYEVPDGGFVVLRMAYGVSADVELLAVKVESFETVYLCAAPSPAPKGIRYFAIRIMEEWDIESPQRYHFVYSDKSAKDSLDLLRATFPVRNPFKPPNMDAMFLSESLAEDVERVEGGEPADMEIDKGASVAMTLSRLGCIV
ncbi:hypothetical protein DACRYDRAFT_117572 [Dacryopinax primogenitus]|uniref:Uncharacterized protein n=1 Tax=Dacryopinax primogenitus (strain DJM 731) TaxID=1858805 RepID=M5FUM5_DACPD|nr:uncharacterized protein DACRYDRAFT_117572 [Dacryopinax primogenitus]EJT99953.1 hypothetical protein DACRYDRAFT_117572 [Dacryopinax primogenitus]